MTSSRRAGFTLFEVLAAVAVLAVVYTVLARVAIVGLRSEGTDRRRAEASLLADRELTALESAIAAGLALENGVTTTEEPPYRISVEVLPEDVMGLLPPPVREEVERTSDDDVATLLVDERGESRIRRLRVVVEWDEAGEPESVARFTHVLDTTGLEALLPPEAAPDAGGDADDPDAIPTVEERLLGSESAEELEDLLRGTGDIE